MLKPVANGIHVHQSEKFFQSNTVVVQGPTGVLLIDPGITSDELTCLAKDLAAAGQVVVAGFSTHPHWDHLLWSEEFGTVPRYGSSRCVQEIQHVLERPDWQSMVATMLPADVGGEISLELMGQLTPIIEGVSHVPWDGPKVRIIEHQAHAFGHAALLVEDTGVLVAGDMLSDILMPMLNLKASDPLADYDQALNLLEAQAKDASFCIPGHGSVASGEQLRDRLELDHTYTHDLKNGGNPDDPRVGPNATFGQGWLPAVHKRQVEQLAFNNQTERKET